MHPDPSKRRFTLQSNQRRLMSKISAAGEWYPGCGWSLFGQGDAYVRGVCETLVNRGILFHYQLGERIGYCMPERIPVDAKILRRCPPAR